jgi:hypothetical protein
MEKIVFKKVLSIQQLESLVNTFEDQPDSSGKVQDQSVSCFTTGWHDQVGCSQELLGNDLETNISQEKHLEKLYQEIDLLADDMKKRLQSDTSFQQAAEKFTKTYRKLSQKSVNAHLITALHKFGWCVGGSISCKNCGIMRRGRKIPIQAKSAGRRRKSLRRGKAATALGRAPSSITDSKNIVNSGNKYFLPIRQRNRSIRREHSLKDSTSKGHQNAGKW